MSITQILKAKKITPEQRRFLDAKLRNLQAKIDKYNGSCMFNDLQEVIKELEKPEWRN